MIAEAVNLLFEATVVISLALLGVLLLRGAWLRLFGARSALLLWLVVPFALVALTLPAPVQHIDPAAGNAVVNPVISVDPLLPSVRERLVDAVPAWAAGAGAPSVSRSVDPFPWLLSTWWAGVLLYAAVLVVSQRRLVRSLGRLTAMPDGTYRSALRQTGPVLVGVLRPRIVLPADFEQRYPAAQQDLVIEHERCHLRRGDAQFTLLACGLRCLFWFNPLVHLAWPRFRMDQELACDAVVLARNPQRRREYAEALLSTRLHGPELPVGCAWRTGHPLKLRIRRIAADPAGSLRTLVGTGLVIASATMAAFGSWAHQAPDRFFVAVERPRLALEILPAEPALQAWIGSRGVAMTTFPMPVEAIPLRPPAAEQDPVEDAPVEHVPVVVTQVPTEPVDSATNENGSSPSAPTIEANAAESEMVEVQHAQLVAARRPAFPESRFQPRLISYPGMPASERPGEDWRPEGGLWVLLLRASLDEQGRTSGAVVEDTNLDNERLVERYQRLAIESLQDWQFDPAFIDGDPVRSEVLLPFYFDTRRLVAPIDSNRVGPARSTARNPPGALFRAVNR